MWPVDKPLAYDEALDNAHVTCNVREGFSPYWHVPVLVG